MKFEDYLKGNKEELNHAVDKNKLWSRIDEKVASPVKSNISFWKLAFVASLIFIGLCIFYLIPKENTNVIEELDQHIALKREMKQLFQQEKTSSRIRAVSLSEDLMNLDEEVIITLVDRMRFDESPNVQLAAMRALESRMDVEIVRVAMIETLAEAKDSYVQIKLINMLSKEKEKRVLPYLDSIIEEEGSKSILSDPAERGIQLLKGI